MDSDAFAGLPAVPIGGTSFAYREQGSGTPVVFIHGTASDLRIWEEQVPVIGESYRAIAYSRRYARPNEDIGPGVDDQVAPHVDDLAAFLDALDISSTHLVGHSWGGVVALLAAGRYPERVRGLILMEPPVISLFVSTPPKPSEILSLLARHPAIAVAIIKFGATTFAPAQKAFQRGDDEEAMRIFGNGVMGKSRFEQLPADRQAQVWENRKASRAQLLGAGFPPLSDDDLRAVKAPVLLLSGEESPAFFRRLTDYLEQHLPNVERIDIPASSHVMQADAPEAVNGAILEFLNRTEGGRPA
jgi:pimeloyl-ACP methyl ester carboxylesterase